MNHRVRRVSEIVKRELGVAISRTIQFDAILVTVSAVDMTPDLKQAHVYISAMGTDAQRADVLRRLGNARAELQAEIARRVVIKHTPHLTFHLDTSVERGSRVLAIMTELGLDIAPDPIPKPHNPSSAP